MLALVCVGVSDLSGCGKSPEQAAQETTAQRLAVQKALAEEREKDRRMQEAAAAEANERIASDAAEHERDLARIAETLPADPQRAERAEAFRKYNERLRQFANDSGSMQVRSAELSPRLNGMCVEINAKTKAGAYAGFKRAVVTDLRVTVEEPPTRELMTQFLLFQIAARDTGCFPDVQSVRILQ